MIRFFKPTWAWLLMAAIALCTYSCSDDDEKNMADPDPEPTVEELAEMAAADRLQAANYVIRAFAGLDALPDNWETSTFTPQEGVVVDEAKPGVRYVIVEDQQAAEQYFLNITPEELLYTTDNGYRLYVEDFGTLTFQRMNAANCFGKIEVSLKQMPSLTEIRLVPESEVPTNAKFDGTPYYGIGSIVKEKSTGYFYICVRPSGGPNRKEYAYFITFDKRSIRTTKKKQDLYEIDEKGKKTKTKASTSGEWTFASNLVEKRFALLAANFFTYLHKEAKTGTKWREECTALLDVYTNTCDCPIANSMLEYIVPYGSYKSSSAGTHRQTKYEQPCLYWAWMHRLGFTNRAKQRAACYVQLRPDAKGHLLTLTDAYDPTYYYDLLKANDFDATVRWDGEKVGYSEPFDIMRYILDIPYAEAHEYYRSPLGWGLLSAAVPVLLMTQLRVTDKGSASSKLEDVVVVKSDVTKEGSTLYMDMLEGIDYFEITDGKVSYYDPDKAKKLVDSPDI